MEGKNLKLFMGIENYQHGIIQTGLYKRTEVRGRDFITERRMYSENKYGQQVIIFFSMKGNYGIEYFIWDYEQGKPVSIEEIIIKD